MEHYFHAFWREMLDDGSMSEALCNYDGPQGKDTLLTSLAALLRKEFDWPITAANIALTNGSQSAFFYLFNLFAGLSEDGTLRRVLFPLAPEYLGYSDAGLEENMFVATKPTLSLLPEGQFKYHVDFEHLKVGEGRYWPYLRLAADQSDRQRHYRRGTAKAGRAGAAASGTVAD